MPNVKVLYEVHGEMNKDKSNIVLHPTSFGAKHPDLRYRIGQGPEYTLDTRKYCVIAVNLLGNGASTSPSHQTPFAGLSSWQWPSFYDNVILHERLLREHLEVDAPLALIFGYSMGAMAALHFGALFPDKVHRIAAVCGASKTSNYNKVFLASLQRALLTDPAWDESENRFLEPPTRGLETFGTIYAGWGLSPDFYREEEFLRSEVGNYSSLEDFVRRSYVGGFASDEAHDLLAMIDTWYAGDISAHKRFQGDLGKALKTITARTWLMPCETDRYFTVEDSKRELELMQAGVAELWPLPSSWGHRAGDPSRPGQDAQMQWITRKVHDLLETEPLM